jgi:hypothetical protein
MAQQMGASAPQLKKLLAGELSRTDYTANWHNFTFLIPHPNPPPLGEGVYEKRRLCQFAVYLAILHQRGIV